MNRVTVFSVIALFASSYAANCPAGSIYSSQFDKCYTYISTAGAYTSAELNCNSLGGHLTSVTNGFESALVSENAGTVFSGQSDFWIGLDDLASPKQFAWIDGKPLTYLNWAVGFPDTTTPGADCVAAAVADGQWKNVACNTQKPYVCEVPTTNTPTCPPAPTCPSLTCPAQMTCTQRACPGNCPNEWTYFNSTDYCYKVFYGKKWDDAEAFCVFEGGHISSIHSELENTFVASRSPIKKREEADLASAGLGLNYAQQTWLGLHAYAVNQFQWTDNTTVDYFNWAPSQPGANATCVEIFSDNSNWPFEGAWYQHWNTYDCLTVMRNFVCKKPATH